MCWRRCKPIFVTQMRKFDDGKPMAALVGAACWWGSALILMLFNGRVAGIVAFWPVQCSTRPPGGCCFWDWTGGLAGPWVGPPCPPLMPCPAAVVLLAGLLVGIGTRLGNGCTSGHGICGMGRLSTRSVVATLTFMGMGVATVFFTHHMF